MNPGIGEEAGKVATSTIEALKGSPALLVLVIFNVLFIATMVYVGIKSGHRWDQEIERWAEFAKACQPKP
jgi:hypothetical protein